MRRIIVEPSTIPFEQPMKIGLMMNLKGGDRYGS
jgi:hypothetical protein